MHVPNAIPLSRSRIRRSLPALLPSSALIAGKSIGFEGKISTGEPTENKAGFIVSIAVRSWATTFSVVIVAACAPTTVSYKYLDLSVTAPKATGRKANITRLTYAVLAGLVLVLVGGLGKLYLDSNTHQAYAKNFVVALYGVKSGTDLGLDLIDSLAGEWQKNLGAGGIAPRASQKDLDKLGKVKQRIRQAMTGLEDCPEKFVTARQKLVRLHGIYEQIYALNVSKANSLDELNASEARLKTAFFKAADDLKRVMPEELSTELKSSVARYNNLNFLVKG